MLLHAWNWAATGWLTIDAAINGDGQGNYYGQGGTSANQNFSGKSPLLSTSLGTTARG